MKGGGFLVIALTAILLAGCGNDRRGGAESLPGPVPTGVSFPEGDPASPPAPEFSLSLMDGTRVTGSELWRDRPVVLFFFASWCGACAEQQGDLTAIAERYHDTVVLLGVAGEDEFEAVKDYLDEHAVPYPAAIDGDLEVWRAYGVREPPHVVVIAKGGRVIRGWPGGVTRVLLEETLSALVDR
ncbi:MAG: TlpA family protein disulfide reductase [Actinomycetota bacterium]|nr:TlpA family protein disulfide reductase [Actinomycetota bacterium]